MADIAGAIAAVKQRLRDNFSSCRIEEENLRPLEPWPPVDSSGNPEAFVVIEVAGSGSDIQGVGQNAAGAQMNIDFGMIRVHVFVPTGQGTATAHSYAAAIAAIFRNTEFYNATPGFAVRTWRPYTDGGGAAEIEGVADGSYWRLSLSTEFQFLHIS